MVRLVVAGNEDLSLPPPTHTYTEEPSWPASPGLCTYPELYLSKHVIYRETARRTERIENPDTLRRQKGKEY